MCVCEVRALPQIVHIRLQKLFRLLSLRQLLPYLCRESPLQHGHHRFHVRTHVVDTEPLLRVEYGCMRVLIAAGAASLFPGFGGILPKEVMISI